MPYTILIANESEQIVSVEIPESVIYSAQSIRYAPDRYFTIDANTIILSIDVLVQTRARFEGIKRAVDLMAQAYEGRHERRVPLTVKSWRDGRYLVIDGNSTLTVARAAGWPDIPCIVVDMAISAGTAKLEAVETPSRPATDTLT